jgi:hypothetical protein
MHSKEHPAVNFIQRSDVTVSAPSLALQIRRARIPSLNGMALGTQVVARADLRTKCGDLGAGAFIFL